MKKHIYTLMFLLCIISNSGYGQSNNENYILTKTMTNNTGSTSIQQVQYFDGLGRPTQAIQIGANPTRKDIISLQEYDNLGRKSEAWLPINIEKRSNGAFIDPSIIRETITASSIYSKDENPFSKPKYEKSASGRILEYYNPGKEWHDQTKKRPVKTDYLTNNSTNKEYSCLLYNVSGTGLLVTLSAPITYSDGELYITRVVDEDSNRLYEFKDKAGQIVLSRQIIDSKINDTYFVYDDFSNLCFVLPPRLADEGLKQEKLDELAYQYKYDCRNRCIYKKLPGVEPIYYIYDSTDQLIFAQDGEQRLKGEWTFTIPDIFSRNVLVGNTLDSKVGTELFNNCENLNVIRAEYIGGNTNLGYKITGYNIEPNLIYTANYYDNYEFNLASSLNFVNLKGYGKQHTSAKTMKTGTATAQLGNTSQGYQEGNIYSVIYYDSRARVIQTQSTNHLEGMDAEYIAYNFVGQPIKKFHNHVNAHSNGISKVEELYTYSYDHSGRLIETRHQLENSKKVLVVKNEYDELGRLKNVNRGVLKLD